MKNEKLKIIIIFAGILLIASFFRLYLLKEIPSGLFPDQAANGSDALRILNDYHTPFFEKGNGREALFFYFQAFLIKIMGIGVYPMFLASAIIGILSVIAAFFLVKVVFGNWPAFFASFFMATSYWHVTLSRTGFRAILVPLFTTFFFLFFALTIKNAALKINPHTKKPRPFLFGVGVKYLYAVLAGIFLGAGFYSYTSYRVIVGIIPIIIFVVFIANIRKEKNKFDWFKKLWLSGLIAFVVSLLVFAPLGYYFYKHPDHIFFRSGHVSIFNPDLNRGDVVGTFIDVSVKTGLSYFAAGDLNFRHNVSGFAFLNPFISALFGFGLLLTFLRLIKIIWLFFANRKKFEKLLNIKYFYYFILFIWFFMMLAPEVITAEGIPHGLRLVGTIPAVFIIAAMAISFLIQKIRLIIKPRIFLISLAIIGVILLLESMIYDYALYFKISAGSPAFYYAYRSDLTVVSNYLNSRANKEKTYLVLDEYSVQTPDFLTANFRNPYRLLNPERSYQVILKKGDQVVFTESTIFDTIKFEKYHKEARLIREEKNKWSEEVMKVYEY